MNIAQQYIVQQLRKELGASEATEHLIDWLLDAWETLEILRDQFGEVRALQLFTAYAPLLQATTTEALVIRKGRREEQRKMISFSPDLLELS